MPANVETMFYVREKPWHGLGVEVQEAPTSADALIYAGLDWEVIQKNVYSEDGSLIAGYKVNTRSTDSAALGIVSDRYKVVQNQDAFQFTDDLLGAGVTYETAGALQGGRKVWMLARMPHRYIIVSVKSLCIKKPVARSRPGNGVKTIMVCKKRERSRAAGTAQHPVEPAPSLVQRTRAKSGSDKDLSHSQWRSG